MKHEEIINLAIQCGLLRLSEEFPKNAPAQQRLISRLVRFYIQAQTKGWGEGIDEIIRQQEELKNHE